MLWAPGARISRASLRTLPISYTPSAWSPHGTRIALKSSRDGNAEIYVVAANGKNQKPLDIRA